MTSNDYIKELERELKSWEDFLDSEDIKEREFWNAVDRIAELKNKIETLKKEKQEN